MEHGIYNRFENFGLPEGKREDGPNGSVYITDHEGYNYEIPKYWNFKNSFTYEDEDLEDIMKNCDPGNSAITEEMLNFVPNEVFMAFGKSSPVRLIHSLNQFSEPEMQKLKEFKEHCKSQGLKIPTRDSEIVRWLCANKMKICKAYDSAIAK